MLRLRLRYRVRPWALAAALLFAAAAQAEVRLEVVGGDEPLRANIAAHVGPLPAADEITAAYRRRAREAAQQGAIALGYYNARIRAERQTRGADTLLQLTVEPGPRVLISWVELRLAGDAAQDPDFAELVAGLPIQQGRPLDHGDYEAAKRALQNLALRRGYFDARFARSRVEVDAIANTASVELEFDSGRRYRFGDVSFSKTPFRDELLRRLVPFEQGQPYHADRVAELNRRLLDSRYFRDVRVRPLPEQAADGHVPVDVRLRAQQPNRMAVGLGYSTDVGPRLRLDWARPWVNSRGHNLSSSLELSDLRQQITGQYAIPLRDPIDDVLELQAGYQNESFEDTESERFTLSVQRQQKLSSDWRRTVFLRWDRENFEQADRTGTSNLVLPGLSFTRTRTRGRSVDPSWGDRLLLTTEVAEPTLGSDVRLARGLVGGRWLRAAVDRHRFYFRADLGGVWSEDFDQVPPSLRFFAGGDQSVRGFGYNTLSPEAANGELAGGRYLLSGTAEYGWNLRKNWRLATFVDAGNAFDDFRAGELKIGTGFGVAWITPVGPVRLDFAWGVSEREIPFRVHFSMGPRL